MYKHQLKYAALLITVLIVGLALSSNPANGRTNAPNESNCSIGGCHGNNPSSVIDGIVDITGIPSTVDAGTTYDLTVTVEYTSGSPTRAGFQMVVLDDTNDEDFGSLSNAGSNSTITPSGGRTYFEHQGAINFGAGTSVSYDVEWTAPSGPDGQDLTFYVASIIANGNGSPTLDRMKLLEFQSTLSAIAQPLVVNTIDQTDITCFGNNDGYALLEVSGGTPPYSFDWDNGETTNPAESLVPGSNIVIIQDDAGEQFTTTIDILEPEELFTEAVIEDLNCAGSLDGSIELFSSGGSPNYMYDWDNGNSGQSDENLTAGTYIITTTDNNLCQTINVYTISEPAPISITNSTVINEECNSLGSISISTEGGTGNLTATWSNNFVGNNNTALSAGDYQVTIEDQNNCQEVQAFTILPSVNLEYETNYNNPTCAEANDGSIDLIFNSPTDYTSIIWSTGEDTPSINNLDQGTYMVTFEDVDFCSYTETFILSDPDTLQITSAIIGPILCSGEAADSLILSVSGGNGQYDFFQTDDDGNIVATNDTILNIPAGIYQFAVSDSNGCSTISTVTITEPESITAVATTTNTSNSGEFDGSASVTISGGTPPYTVAGFGTLPDSIALFANLGAGDYTVNIIDSMNCAFSAEFTIGEGDDCTLVGAEIEIIQPECPGDEPEISINPIGGSAPFDFIIPTDNFYEGNYTVIITDNNDCQVLETIAINYTDTESPTITNIIVDPVYLDESGLPGSFESIVQHFDNCGDDTEVILNIEGNASCEFGQSDLILSVEISDAVGNITDTSIQLTVLDTFPPELICPLDMTISDCATFQIENPMATDNCGVANIDMSITSNPTTNVDTYIFEATDFFGNTTTCETLISIEVDFEYDVTVQNISCFGFDDGMFVIETNNTLDVTYENDSTDNLEAGVYYFSVSDGECSVTDSIVILEPTEIITQVEVIHLSEAGAMDGSLEVEITGGVEPYQITWYDYFDIVVGTGPIVTNLAEGIYWAVIEDSNGCDTIISDISLSFESSVDDEVFSNAILYPNPAVNELYIVTDIELENVKIFDAQGKFIKHYLKPGTSINIGGLSPGAYLIELIADEKRAFRKLIKQ